LRDREPPLREPYNPAKICQWCLKNQTVKSCVSKKGQIAGLLDATGTWQLRGIG
jgi:hypothetical protein